MKICNFFLLTPYTRATIMFSGILNINAQKNENVHTFFFLQRPFTEATTTFSGILNINAKIKKFKYTHDIVFWFPQSPKSFCSFQPGEPE